MLDIALDVEDMAANNPDKNSVFMELACCEGGQIMNKETSKLCGVLEDGKLARLIKQERETQNTEWGW